MFKIKGYMRSASILSFGATTVLFGPNLQTASPSVASLQGKKVGTISNSLIQVEFNVQNFKMLHHTYYFIIPDFHVTKNKCNSMSSESLCEFLPDLV
jgi:hypothetical protein